MQIVDEIFSYLNFMNNHNIMVSELSLYIEDIVMFINVLSVTDRSCIINHIITSHINTIIVTSSLHFGVIRVII